MSDEPSLKSAYVKGPESQPSDEWASPVEMMQPLADDPLPPPARRSRLGRVRFTRPLTDAEKDVLLVAAELTRASWDIDLPPGMHERMQAWGQRLKADYDTITGPLRVLPDEFRPEFSDE